ncbi:hypothetical protein DW779_06895 [Clostridium sp. AM30-24]|nr:hypothetical protein [Clostridium sp. AM30-24]RHT42848.1 hypothetical protein DW779_06895 [Clostridium sp. AM30-24]
MSKYDRKKLNNGDNLNVKLGPYGSASNDIVGSLLNKPTQVVSGEVTIDWYPSNDNSNYGTQILRHTRDNTINIYFRAKKGSVDNWSEWISLATKDDLNERFSSSDSGTTYNSVSDFPTTGSGFGVNTKNLTLYTGFVIPDFSRICYMNYGNSPDGALIAIAPSGEIYSAFRNSGVWQNGKVR